MLNSSDYKSKCSNLKIKTPIPYPDYVKYENLWIQYMNNIVLPAINNQQPTCVRLILCESGPKSSIHPNPQYIFNPNSQKVPEYLEQIRKGINYGKLAKATGKTKVLDDLARHVEGPVIILDIMPSHGIDMSKYRKNADNYPNQTVDIDKVHWLIKVIKEINIRIEVLAVFATPPNTTRSLNVPYAIDPCISWYLPTINAGQGQKPSWQALSRLVDNGFRCNGKSTNNQL
jgi:hypothetical protein